MRLVALRRLPSAVGSWVARFSPRQAIARIFPAPNQSDLQDAAARAIRDRRLEAHAQEQRRRAPDRPLDR